MGIFSSYDGTKLAYHGDGSMIGLPGGPMQDSSYLPDLPMVRLDPRGTGESEIPADPSSYRCDRQVEDVEALRLHLGLDRITLLGHSAGTNLAVLYATRYPERVAKLVLVTPSPFAVGLNVSPAVRRAVMRHRAEEPWFAKGSAAFERIVVGQGTPDDWADLVPFTYGRWDAKARAHHAAQRRNDEAAAIFGSAFDPAATRDALAGFTAPTLLIAGTFDTNSPVPIVAEYADLFPQARMDVLAGGGHFPWLDHPSWFAETVESFIR
ncbi:hydrolase [Lentzea sp. NBRC 105346]|uniref:alpha/beta fold hydrolase n=1 Tax=Lentzea sp. NBRC 105346 TaxID=3032205 RepID=UPI0024A451FB|nr:alpha/beta hydrolase [Lentzea sp. NBRC 105346]GLZ33229.1 hydrolase [Lentzea sp. NBRC 105346]